MENRNPILKVLLSVMLCFFTMGFVDLVGVASNYVQKDLGLSDAKANLMPSLVFFWFLIFSVPTGMLMNRIGRKKTVVLSIYITALSLLLPLFGSSYILMLISFSILGIGNTLMQTSLNPLISNIVPSSSLASTLTFGQFVKAIASFMAPYIAIWGAVGTIPSIGLGWKVLFPLYMLIAVIAVFALSITKIEEEKVERAAGIANSLAQLKNPFVLLCFLGIMCHVGIDVGINTTAPKLFIERLGIGLDDAAKATSLYFIFRTAGCFLGSFMLRFMNSRIFFGISAAMIVVSLGLMLSADTMKLLYICVALVGLGNSNIFSVVFSQALIGQPQKRNEVSGLMIMGLFGGTLFPIVMGYASDLMGQVGSVIVMIIGAAYLMAYTFFIRKEN